MAQKISIRRIRFLFSGVTLITGFMFLVITSLSVGIVCKVLGAFLSIFGLAELFLYITAKRIRYRLVFGAAFAILGAIMVSLPDKVVFLGQLLVGVLVIVDGMYKIRVSFELRTRHIRLWPLPLLVSVAMVVLGVALLFWDSTGAFLPRMFGIVILINSVAELGIGLYTIFYRKKKPIQSRYDRASGRVRYK